MLTGVWLCFQIKSYGDGWEEDVVSLLKSDMKSLAQEEGGSMTMQQRVIQSGLDSIILPESPSIVRLFKVPYCQSFIHASCLYGAFLMLGTCSVCGGSGRGG